VSIKKSVVKGSVKKAALWPGLKNTGATARGAIEPPPASIHNDAVTWIGVSPAAGRLRGIETELKMYFPGPHDGSFSRKRNTIPIP
jgi:hypothetical protein